MPIVVTQRTFKVEVFYGYKKMLDAGVITEEDYNKLKAKLLGL